MPKISSETIIRTLALAVSLVNQLLLAFGKNPLPFADDDAYALLSTIVTAGVAIWNWWKNNSFSKNALEADDYLRVLNKLAE